MKNAYTLRDRDDQELYGVFKSDLDFDAIQKIIGKTDDEFAKEGNTLSKSGIFFDFLGEEDQNYEQINFEVVYI